MRVGWGKGKGMKRGEARLLPFGAHGGSEDNVGVLLEALHQVGGSARGGCSETALREALFAHLLLLEHAHLFLLLNLRAIDGGCSVTLQVYVVRAAS